MATSISLFTIAKGRTDISLLPKMANRHGLIAGATGTGKTVSLRVLAEQFSQIGRQIIRGGSVRYLAVAGDVRSRRSCNL